MPPDPGGGAAVAIACGVVHYPFLDVVPGISDFAVMSSPNANVGRAGVTPSVVMLHATDGSGDADSVGRLFANRSRRASSTFTIGRPGEVRQHVPLDWTAWDAGGGHLPSDAELEQAVRDGKPVKHDPRRHGSPSINRRSVSFELCNRAMIDAATAAKLGPDRVFEGRSRNPASRNRLWEAYPPAQEVSLLTCLQFLSIKVPTLRWLTMHEDVFSIFMPGGVTKTKKGKELGSKLDPGPAFEAAARRLPLQALGLHRVRYEHKARQWVVDPWDARAA
jgi:N-acetyl-anhydromuramyl-L-alanine amidase AmpD